MPKRSLNIISLMIFLLKSTTSGSAIAAEAINLQDGITLYGYNKFEIPDTLQKTTCDKYIFSNAQFDPIRDDRYIEQSGKVFMVEHNCLYPRTGQARLRNGEFVEFYQESVFGEQGDLVYKKQASHFFRIRNATLQLESNESFLVVDGYIDNYGHYENEHIIYENRD